MADIRHKPDPTLEAEVIWAVVILYLFICGAMLGIHYLQPRGQETQTSSMSPSHEHFRTDDLSGEDRPVMSEGEVEALLARQGYEDIRNLRLDDEGHYRGTAMKDDQAHRVVIDPAAGVIIEQPLENR